MLVTKPGGEIAVVHTLKFADAAQRNQFHEYASTPDGLTAAREAPGNLFVSPYNSLRDDPTVYIWCVCVADVASAIAEPALNRF